MKLTKSTLKQIIKEELQAVLNEQQCSPNDWGDANCNKKFNAAGIATQRMWAISNPTLPGNENQAEKLKQARKAALICIQNGKNCEQSRKIWNELNLQ